MARWHYPRSRRILMQIAMCVIFGGSVGLAALVVHQRKVEGFTRLSGMQYEKNTGIRLPVGWTLEHDKPGNVILIAREPDTDDRQGRTLTVRRQKVDSAMTPEEYLQNSKLLKGTRPYAPDGQNPIAAEPITFADAPGVLMAIERRTGFLLFGPSNYEPEWIACAVRHSGLAITLQLSCPDGTNPDEDKQTLRDIAAAIDVKE